MNASDSHVAPPRRLESVMPHLPFPLVPPVGTPLAKQATGDQSSERRRHHFLFSTGGSSASNSRVQHSYRYHCTSINAFLLSQSSPISLFSHSASPRARCTPISIHAVISSKLSSIPPAFCSTQSVGEELEPRCVRATCSVEGRRMASRCDGSTIGCGLVEG